MYLTTKIQVATDNRMGINTDILNRLCYHSARLYNVALYSVRQHYFNTQSYLNYYGNYHECKDNENYHMLLVDNSAQIVRLVDRDMQSFFKLLKMKQVGKYSEKVRLPHYKPKEGLTTYICCGRTCRIQKNGTIEIGLTKAFREAYGFPEKKLVIPIPSHLHGVTAFKEVRIIPQYNGKQYCIEFVYESGSKYQQASGDGYMSIDVGVDNFAACTIFSNGDARQFLIDGRILKNINHYYNKKVAELKSEYAKNSNITSTNTPRMLRLMNGRNNRFDDYFNKAVKMIIDACLANGVTTLVIGYNKEQKQDVNIGHVNNQNLCYIPHYKFRQKLQYKCELHGIAYCPQEESYTSKASALDFDFIPTYGDEDIPSFSGRRVKRGLYKSADGSVLNADINGSVNILRKYFKERESNGLVLDDVRALINAPCKRLNAFSQTPSFRWG
ncbi:MAG: transposase [Bacteroidales bacterium]|nr:transposase [Bacteroidales bacterium]